MQATQPGFFLTVIGLVTNKHEFTTYVSKILCTIRVCVSREPAPAAANPIRRAPWRSRSTLCAAGQLEVAQQRAGGGVAAGCPAVAVGRRAGMR